MRWPAQEVAAAQAVVDLEREREPGGRPADPLDRVVHLDRDLADADVVGDGDADDRPVLAVGAARPSSGARVPRWVMVKAAASPGCRPAVRWMRSVADCTLSPLTAVITSPSCTPALAAGRPGVTCSTSAPRCRIVTGFPSACSATASATTCDVSIAWMSCVRLLLLGLARQHQLVHGHEGGAVHQVAPPQLLELVRLDLVDVDEVEPRSGGGLLAAGHVQVRGGRVGLVGPEHEVARRRLPGPDQGAGDDQREHRRGAAARTGAAPAAASSGDRESAGDGCGHDRRDPEQRERAQAGRRPCGCGRIPTARSPRGRRRSGRRCGRRSRCRGCRT